VATRRAGIDGGDRRDVAWPSRRVADGFCAPFPDDRVRLTSIYSKGVVRWQAQLVRYAGRVEVTGSHVGLVFNRKIYRAIAQALAAPKLAPGLPERPDASLV
jgi:hypothetical protein